MNVPDSPAQTLVLDLLQDAVPDVTSRDLYLYMAFHDLPEQQRSLIYSIEDIQQGNSFYCFADIAIQSVCYRDEHLNLLDTCEPHEPEQCLKTADPNPKIEFESPAQRALSSSIEGIRNLNTKSVHKYVYVAYKLAYAGSIDPWDCEYHLCCIKSC